MNKVYLALTSLFFLSSMPSVEATHGSIPSSWSDPRYSDGRWLHTKPRALARPLVFKAPKTFEVIHPEIPYAIESLDVAIIQQKAYIKSHTKPSGVTASFDGPTPKPRDWRKFWLWFSTIGTGALALGSVLLYGQWRSVK